MVCPPSDPASGAWVWLERKAKTVLLFLGSSRAKNLRRHLTASLLR